MARGRPHGRSKSDNRVCQAARYAGAAEYRERISISAEQQEARIAAVNAECDVQDAPQKRRSQKSSGWKKEAWTARGSAQRRDCKASRSGKKKAKQRLEKTIGKAAERDLHSLHCNACGATAEFGLRGGKEGGSVKYSCRAHATLHGCFCIDQDRADWVEDRELRRLRAEERSLEEELRNLGGNSFVERPASAWNEPQSMGDWTSVPKSKSLIDASSAPPFAGGQESESTMDWVSMHKSRSLIATLLLRGGVESNPGPISPEEREMKVSIWRTSNINVRPTAEEDGTSEVIQVLPASAPEEAQRHRLLEQFGKDEKIFLYDGTLRAGGAPVFTEVKWTEALKGSGVYERLEEHRQIKVYSVAGGGGRGAGVGPSADVEMRDADTSNQSRLPQRLSDDQVLARLESSYGASFVAHIKDKSSSSSKREAATIKPNGEGIVDALGECLRLEGYDEFAKRGLMALLKLQSRSDKVKLTSENPDDKFREGTQLLRIVGAPGTGKTTALTFLWRYIYDHFDELAAALPPPDDDRVDRIRERVRSSLQLDHFLSFVFSNEGLTQLLPAEDPSTTGDFMATRMLYAMLGVRKQGVVYEEFIKQLDPDLRLSLEPRHLMGFIQRAAGLGCRRGLVVFNFDECGAPEPKTSCEPTYFQHGLSSLVSWRLGEALRRYRSEPDARDLLPVVVISGTHSARMNLLKTSSGRAKIYNLGRPALRDEDLLSIAMNAITRMAAAEDREVPESAAELLQALVVWAGWNPRTLVRTLCFAGEDDNTEPGKQLSVARLWKFLQLPPASSQDSVLTVIKKVEHDMKTSNWDTWLRKVGDKYSELLFHQALAHTIIGCPVARDDVIGSMDPNDTSLPTARITWGDAESDGFVALTDHKFEIQWGSKLQPQRSDLSDEDSLVASAQAGGSAGAGQSASAGPSALNKDEGSPSPDSEKSVRVYIPPLLLRVMYHKLGVFWTRVRSLEDFRESWVDREHNDVALLMLRLQLARTVFGKETMPSEELCPGLDPLGDVIIPTDGYIINRVRQKLTKSEFIQDYLNKAKLNTFWAYLGPGNWGVDGWLILFGANEEGTVGAEERKIVIYTQSKKRTDITRKYSETAAAMEAGKCWDVEGVESCLLYLTDEKGRDEDNEWLERGEGVRVVVVSRDARFATYGPAVATVKRSLEIIEQMGLSKKRKT